MKMKRNYTYLGAAALVLAAATLACSLFGAGASSTVTPQPTSTPSVLTGDFGDAPDDEDAGYYAPSGGPFLFTYDATGIQGSFPTYGRDSIPGAFTVDVDEFWIGPLFGRGGSSDIPSLENDADDPGDPDGIGNLTDTGGGADCDMENGSHNPAATGCASQAAYTMPMNARLSIMFGQPPLGIWITSVTASENMTYSGPVYWNLLFDLNQDGDWEDSGEWIAQDVLVDLQPGETETLISPAFRFPTSGSPWGRLNFPYWVRSTVTSESTASVMSAGSWDGRGPEDGFKVGEVEDYFVEWQPIGQKRQGGGGAGAGGSGGDGGGEGEQTTAGDAGGSGSGLAGDPLCAPIDARELELLPSIGRDLDEIIRLSPGIQVEKVTVLSQSGSESLIQTELVGELELSPGAELNAPFSGGAINLIMTEYSLDLEVDLTGDQAVNILLLPENQRSGNCFGNAPVEVGPAFYREFPPAPTKQVSLFGEYITESVYDSGDQSHGPFALGDQIENINAEEGPGGGITFSGPPPFVTVTGDYDPGSGRFSTEGLGIVAGFPDISVKFDGTLTLGEGLKGLYEMGAQGGLPGEESITYQIEGRLTGEEVLQATPTPESGPPSIAPGVEGAIQDYIDVFNQSFVDRDPDPLFELLHPAVLEIYGEAQCRSYLEEVVQVPTSLEYNNGQFFGGWTFDGDGFSLPVEDVYLVDVNFTVRDQTLRQNLHLDIPGDDSVRWFTDCGEPLAE